MTRNAKPGQPGKSKMDKAMDAGKYRWCPDCTLRGALNSMGFPVKRHGEPLTARCEMCKGSARVPEWDSW